MSRKPLFKFRLYVAGDAHNSTQALANLLAYCQTHLPDRHDIEIVDVFKEPKRAQADGILMTPTLIKYAPSPVRKVVGTLSQKILSVGLDDAASRPAKPASRRKPALAMASR